MAEDHLVIMAEDHSMINTEFSQFITLEALMHQCDIIAGQSDGLAIGLFDISSFKSACSEVYHLGPHDFMDPAEIKVRNMLFRVMLGLTLQQKDDYFHFLPHNGEEIPPGKIGVDSFGILGQHRQFSDRIDIMSQAMGSSEFYEAIGDPHMRIREWTQYFSADIIVLTMMYLGVEEPSDEGSNSEENDEEIDVSSMYVPDHSRNWTFVTNLEEVEIATIAAEELRCPFCWNEFGVVDTEETEAETSINDYQHFLDAIPRERLNDPVRTPCGHLFGKGCLFISMTTSPLCPVCREPFHPT